MTKLNPKQELFCQYFASDREFFGNGIQSYVEAYDIDLTKKGAYNTAKVNAHRLLTKANILVRIDELFEAGGLNDSFVDKQLEKLITQDAEYSAKVAAIKEYNQLKQRITKKIKFEGEIPIALVKMFDDKPTDS
jgi:hypothetical protein